MQGADKRFDRGRPACGIGEQGRQAVARTGCRGLDLQCARVPRRSGRAVAQFGSAQVSHAHEERDQVILFLLPDLRAQCEPVRPAFGLREKLEQRLAGFAVVSPGLQQFLQRRDGFSHLAQVRALHTRELHEIGAALRRRQVGVRAPAQHHGQISPAFGRGQPIHQAVERLAVVRVGLQPRLPQPHGSLDLAPLRGQGSGLAQQSQPRAGRGLEGSLLLQHIQTLGSVLLALQKLGQLTQCRQHLGRLRRLVLHHLSIQRLRIGGGFVTDLRRLQPIGHAQLGIQGGARSSQQTPPVRLGRAGRLGQVLEPNAQGRLVGIERQHLHHLLARRWQIALLVQVVGDLAHQHALLRRLGEAERGPQRSHQAVGPVLLGVAGAQNVERAPAYGGREVSPGEHTLGHGARRAVVGKPVVGQDAVDLVQRLFGLAKLVHAQDRQTQARLVRLAPWQKRQANAQHVGQGLPKTLLFQETFQGRGDVRSRGRGVKERLQIADGPLRRARVTGDRGRLLQETMAAGTFGHTGQGLIVGGEHLFPALLDREQDGDALERPVGVRVRRQNLAQKLDRAIGLARVPFLEEAQGSLPERGHQLGFEARLEQLAIDSGHLVGLLLLARQRLGLIPDRCVAWFCLGRGQRRLQLLGRGLVLVGSGLVRIISSRTC